MDPRHPEQAISRMVDLMTQFNLILKDMKHSTVSSQLGQLEREGGLVVQEICLVAPRLHEAMMQTSRQRRHQLSMGITYVPEEKVGKYTKATIGIKKDVNESEEKVDISEPDVNEKPKKKTAKKKTTKKKADK